VAEKNGTKGVLALSAHPTAVLRSPSRRRRRSVYRPVRRSNISCQFAMDGKLVFWNNF